MSGADEELSGNALCIDAAWDSAAAVDAVKSRGAGIAAVANRQDVMKGPFKMRKIASGSGAACAVLTTRSWDRQVVPQICELSLVMLSIPTFRLDLRTGSVTLLTRGHLVRRAAALPFVLLRAVLDSAVSAFRDSRSRRDSSLPTPVEVQPGDGVIVIWLIREELQVGGGISHIAGILSGFKAAGIRVGLIARAAPPKQLEGLVDDVELLGPLPERQRCLPFTELIALNDQVRDAGKRLASRFDAKFVYERHAPYLAAGCDVAESLGLPLVLEVNGPEVWSRLNWAARVPGEKAFVPMLKAIEKRSLEDASLVVPVSTNAGKAACAESGASPKRLLVSPNAVDVDRVERIIAGIKPPEGETIRMGWVGSFGPWHGAPLLIEAMAELPDNVTALMIGSGAERAECMELAESLGVLDRVDMPGAMHHDDALRALAGCHMLVSPHVPTGDQPFFGSPTKLFDFMAVGRPTVASDLEQIGEVLEDGVTAILVKPGDLASLVDGIRRLIALPDRGVSLGIAAREEARRNHTWTGRVDAIISGLAGNQTGWSAGNAGSHPGAPSTSLVGD